MIEYAEAIVHLFDKYNIYDQAFIETQSDMFAGQMLLSSAGVTNGEIKQFMYPQSFEEGLNHAATFNMHGITIANKNISKEQVELAHTLGYWVTIWDVEKNSEIREAVRKNPDMIQTDDVPYLVKILE